MSYAPHVRQDHRRFLRDASPREGDSWQDRLPKVVEIHYHWCM